MEQGSKGHLAYSHISEEGTHLCFMEELGGNEGVKPHTIWAYEDLFLLFVSPL